jgi:hypothetical protein
VLEMNSMVLRLTQKSLLKSQLIVFNPNSPLYEK